MSWWARLWHRTRMEEQLEKELRFHLEQRENALIARGSTARSPARSRRSRAGKRKMPRCSRHTLVGDAATGHQLCAPHIPSEARLRRNYAVNSGARNRRDDCHVRRSKWRSAPASSVPEARPVGNPARIYKRLWRVLGILLSRFHRPLSRNSICEDRRLDRG
jgi:hypothetical protein